MKIYNYEVYKTYRCSINHIRVGHSYGVMLNINDAYREKERIDIIYNGCGCEIEIR